MKDATNLDKKMICTDLDGTLIGDDFSMYELLETLEAQGILLTFITGRHLPSVIEFIEEKETPKPDACICQVGTEIYLLQGGELALDMQWNEIISKDWNRDKIVRLLGDIKELRWQDEEWQTRFKISYFLRENQPEVLKEVNERIEKSGLEANIVYSHDEFLDLLPVKSGKGEAVIYLSDKFDIRTDAVAVCGDSGNDLDMFKAGFKGVIVGNAYAELKNFEGDNAYHADAEYSAGIIEGLKHFGFI